MSSDIFRLWNYFVTYILAVLAESHLLSNILSHYTCPIPYWFSYNDAFLLFFFLCLRFPFFPSFFFHIFFSRSLAPTFHLLDIFLYFFLYRCYMFSFCIQNSSFDRICPFPFMKHHSLHCFLYKFRIGFSFSDFTFFVTLYGLFRSPFTEVVSPYFPSHPFLSAHNVMIYPEFIGHKVCYPYFNINSF